MLGCLDCGIVPFPEGISKCPVCVLIPALEAEVAGLKAQLAECGALRKRALLAELDRDETSQLSMRAMTVANREIDRLRAELEKATTK